MNTFEFWVARLLLLCGFAIATAILVLTFDALFHGFLDRHHGVATLLTALLVVWGILVLILANAMARQLVFHRMSLADAFRVSVMETRINLSFVPGLGRWLAPHEDERDDHSNKPIE